jgi:ATP-dependent DNA helicase PIF1
MNTTTFEYEGEKFTIELTEEFEKAYNLMELTDDSFFVTGKAGTGKSTLLRYFRSQTKKRVAVVAFTGLAAINVEGQTIHSFFGFPLGFIHPNAVKLKEDMIFLMKSLDTIIVDEVSMLRADLMDAMDKSLRIHRGVDKPFGGTQMIFIGDLYQLPPIIEKELADVYSKYYLSPYFFSADVFNKMRLPYINLEKIHRQSDPEFIEILNSIRERTNLSNALEKLNKNVEYDYTAIKEGETVVLSTTNDKVREINQFFLSKIILDSYSYTAFINGDFDPKSYPTEETLTFKEGAKVMFVKNDPDKQFVNGDIGIITKLTPFSIEVRVKGSTVLVKKLKWEKVKYKYVPSDNVHEKGTVSKNVIGEFEQYPLRLAWAITIHKSQGQTYNSVFIDLHTGSFTSGQTYVALSRCKTLNGIKLQRPITERDVILDRRINEFTRTFEAVL